MFDYGYQTFGGKPTMFIIVSHDMSISYIPWYHHICWWNLSLSYDHYVPSIQITIKPHKTKVNLSWKTILNDGFSPCQIPWFHLSFSWFLSLTTQIPWVLFDHLWRIPWLNPMVNPMVNSLGLPPGGLLGPWGLSLSLRPTGRTEAKPLPAGSVPPGGALGGFRGFRASWRMMIWG